MKDEEKKELLSEEESESTEMGEAAKSTAEVAKALKTSKIITIISAFVAVVAVATVALVFGGKDEGNHTHSFGEWSVTKASACENDGVKERYCDCGEKQTLAIEATGHTYGDWTVVEEATCANEGSEKRECECGKKETRSIDKINTHIEVIDQAVDATCTSPGRTEGKHCSVCNKVFVEQMETPVKPHTYDDEYDGNCNDCGFEIIPACRHDNTVVLAGKEPTCTDTGLTEGKKCADCDETLVAQTTIKANGHTEGSWIIDKSATCLAEGKKHQECSVCNATIDEAKIDPLGHTEGAWIIDKKATCTTVGSKHTECTVCHEKIRNDSIDKLPHTESDWIVEVKETCTSNGSKYIKCTVCNNKIKTESISKLGHVDSEWIVDKAPTCTETGKAHKHCSRCNKDYNEKDLVANGHTNGSPVEKDRVEATCTTDGYYYKVVYCTVDSCKAEISKKKETIRATGHNYVSYICTRCEQPQAGVKLVYSFSDLANIKNNLSAIYVLMNDIDCGGLAVTPIGTGSNNAFSGVFDGQGYSISNFVASNSQYIGLFGYSTGTIRNLNVDSFNFDFESNNYDMVHVGGIVAYNAGVVEKCSATDGDIYICSTSERRGGLLCGTSAGKINNCYAVGKVYITQPSQNEKLSLAGGLVAYNLGSIENCFADATVHADGYFYFSYGPAYKGYRYYGEAALLSGVNGPKSTIKNCFVMGSVTYATNRAGDISGYCYDDGVISNCYKDANTVVYENSSNTHTYSTALSVSAMSSSSFFSATLGWDSSIWNFTNVNLSNKVYPTLR